MSLHACLAFIRMRADPGAEPLAQIFADKLFRQFDAGLREDGVGDLVVSKRMRKLAQAFYGRLKAYGDALSARDQAVLAEAVARNVPGVEVGGFGGVLAAYMVRAADEHAAAPVSNLFRLDGWPPAPS